MDCNATPTSPHPRATMKRNSGQPNHAVSMCCGQRLHILVFLGAAFFFPVGLRHIPEKPPMTITFALEKWVCWNCDFWVTLAIEPTGDAWCHDVFSCNACNGNVSINHNLRQRSATVWPGTPPAFRTKTEMPKGKTYARIAFMIFSKCFHKTSISG